MAQLNLGHLLRLVSSILENFKSFMSSTMWFGNELLRKCEIIFGKLAVIEMRQCHNSMSENEAVRRCIRCG